VELYLYLERPSPVHRLHPLTKIALLAGTCALALLLRDARHLLGVAGLVLAATALGRSLENLRRVRLFLVLASVFAVLLWTLVGRGPTPLFLWTTREGLLAGVAAALRIDAFILAGALFLSTTRNEEIVQGLLQLGLPYPLCFAFSTALRLAPTFVGTGWAVREAQKARGLDPDAGSIATRIRNNVPLLVPTFLTTIRMTSHLAMSLEAKGFGLHRRRTSLLETRWGLGDLAALLLLAAALAGGVVLRYDLLMPPRSVGCVVVREGKLLLVHPSGAYNRGKPWSIPKGEAVVGEADEVTALRETREETGLDCRVLGDLGSIVQKGGKEVRAFLAEVLSGTILPDGSCPGHDWEVDEARFLPPEEALARVKNTQRPLLERALATTAAGARRTEEGQR
jgi:energy-coupling factor transport system permease protein